MKKKGKRIKEVLNRNNGIAKIAPDDALFIKIKC